MNVLCDAASHLSIGISFVPSAASKLREFPANCLSFACPQTAHPKKPPAKGGSDFAKSVDSCLLSRS